MEKNIEQFREALRRRSELKAKLIKARSGVAKAIAELAEIEQQLCRDYPGLEVELSCW